MGVIYVRLDDEMHEGAKEVAASAQISLRALMEVVLAERMGDTHPLSPAVKKAFQRHRKAIHGGAQ